MSTSTLPGKGPGPGGGKLAPPRHGAAEYSRSFLARRNKHGQYLEFFLYCISVEDKKPKKSEAKYLDLFNRLLNHIIHTIGGFGSISYDRIDISHGPK